MKEKAHGMASLTELYRIGRGPSSSHTMGPSHACRAVKERYPDATRFEVTLYGSLSKTGKGHRTDYAIRKTLGEDRVSIVFDNEKTDLAHPNTMEIAAFAGDKLLCRKTVYSIGGGAIRFADEKEKKEVLPYPDISFTAIEERLIKENLTLPEYAEKYEGKELRAYMALVLDRMKRTVENGLSDEGIIPGGLNIPRKAKKLFAIGQGKDYGHEKEIYLISAYAYAASEENACGEEMVTAPTCGASGVLPAVLLFKQRERGYSDEELISALEVAGIVGNLIKTNASISGAECGCQAEIGSACGMAAAAFAYLKGMNPKQIECAAEIALEHHLGLTCDPVRGLVQIPCIERNAVAAMRAVDAVSLAEMLYENRKISLDLVIRTLYETGKDLSCRYRETAEGGLAVLYPSEAKGGKDKEEAPNA